jgi:hypothetical protein
MLKDDGDIAMADTVPSVVVGFIDRSFKRAKTQQEDDQAAYSLDREHHAALLAALLEMVDRVPDGLLRLDIDRAGELFAATGAIRRQFDLWLTGEKQLQDCGFGHYNPATLIRRALAGCPDQAVPSTTADLKFVADGALRDSLRHDLAAAEAAFTNGEWKAATVLAGSVIEALLLDAIEQRDPVDLERAVKSVAERLGHGRSLDTNPERWDLHQYIEIASELKILAEPATTQ